MKHRLVRNWPLVVGITLAVVLLLLLAALESALPVVIDLRPPLAVVSSLATGLFIIQARRMSASARRNLVLGAVAAAGIVTALAGYDLTLRDPTREMSIVNGDVRLGGTLIVPPGAGPHPAVVLIHGSGRQPRKEYLFYARQYARRGVAALAYDKRGSGVSTTSATTVASYDTLASDAAAAMAWLRQQPDVDPARVGVWGLSEGEWVGAIAAKNAGAAFLVIVSPSAMTPAEQVAYEASVRVRRAGFSETEAVRARELYRAVSRFERSGEGRDELNQQLDAASREPWFEAAGIFDVRVPSHEEVQRLEWFPVWRTRMDFDPLPVLAALTCPVLAQVGGRDPKNDGERAIARMSEAIATGRRAPFDGRVYPLAEHSLVEWRLPGRVPPPFFAAGALDDQIEWVRQHVGAR